TLSSGLQVEPTSPPAGSAFSAPGGISHQFFSGQTVTISYAGGSLTANLTKVALVGGRTVFTLDTTALPLGATGLVATFANQAELYGHLGDPRANFGSQRLFAPGGTLLSVAYPPAGNGISSASAQGGTGGAFDGNFA